MLICWPIICSSCDFAIIQLGGGASDSPRVTSRCFLHMRVCDFMIFFPALLLHAVSPSWQRGRSGQGKRKAWPKKLLRAPARLSGVACGYALLSFSPAPKIEGCWIVFSFWFLFGFFFKCHRDLILLGWILSLPCTPQKAIDRYFSALILPLFGPPCSFVHWNLPSFISVLPLHFEKSPPTL